MYSWAYLYMQAAFVIASYHTAARFRVDYRLCAHTFQFFLVPHMNVSIFLMNVYSYGAQPSEIGWLRHCPDYYYWIRKY